MLSEFCFKKLSVDARDLFDMRFISKLESLADIVEIDIKTIDFMNNFPAGIINYLKSMDIQGVIMQLSEELEYITSEFKNKIYDIKNDTKSKFLVLNKNKSLEVIFFDGIIETSISIINDVINENKDKKIYFNFDNMSFDVLNLFLPSFIGWSISNTGRKNIYFSGHNENIKNILADNKIFCMAKVTSLISLNKTYNDNNCKITGSKINNFIKVSSHQL